MEKEKVLEIEIKKINSEYSAFYAIKIDIDELIEISDEYMQQIATLKSVINMCQE